METIDVTAAVIRRDGALLIAQRPPGVHLGGLWEFPGGKREEGETLETIANVYDTTNDLLADLNRTSIRASLAEGQLLVVLPGLRQRCSNIAADLEADPEADLASTG